MAERPGVLRIGDRVLFGGGEHQVVGLAGNAVRLLAVSGEAAVVALPYLLAAPDFAIVGTGTAAAGRAPRLAPLGLLESLPEAVARPPGTGSGTWSRSMTGRAAGCPGRARRRGRSTTWHHAAGRAGRAKAAELTAAGVKASVRTVRRMRYRYREQGLWGLVDTRHAPAARPTGNVDPRVVAAAAAVIDAQTGTSTGHPGPGDPADHRAGWRPSTARAWCRLPSRATFYRLLAVLSAGRHTFGSAVDPPRSTAGRPAGVVHRDHRAARPGEQVQMDAHAAGRDGGDGRRGDRPAGAGRRGRCRDPDDLRGGAAAGRRQGGGRGAAAGPDDGARADAAGLGPGRWRCRRPGFPHRRLVSIDARLELAAAKPVIVPDTVVIDHGKVFVSEVFLRAADTLGRLGAAGP